MGFLSGLKRNQPEPERPSIRKYGEGEMAYRFDKPFAHMKHVMTPEEQRVVEGIEARWRERYDFFKNYPAMSESQEWERKVFQTVDDAYRAMDARKDGNHKDWKALEENVEKAFGAVRDAFSGQRKNLEQQLSEQRKYERKLAPDGQKDRARRQNEKTTKRSSPSWER